MSGIWTERDPSKDETQIGDQKALSLPLRTIHFKIYLKYFFRGASHKAEELCLPSK